MHQFIINAEVLESWRVANGKSIEELAKGSGVDRTSMVRILNGTSTRLRGKTFQGILEFTGLPAAKLLNVDSEYLEPSIDIQDTDLLKKYIETFGPLRIRNIPTVLNLLRK